MRYLLDTNVCVVYLNGSVHLPYEIAYWQLPPKT